MVTKHPTLVNWIAGGPIARERSDGYDSAAMKVLFLDESGDHNLSAIDPVYPIFVLGGVIVDKAYSEGPLTRAFDDFKRRMFNSTDIVLHTADIVRTRNGFEALKDNEFRAYFYTELNTMMQDLRYSVVACVIHKFKYVRPFEPYQPNLYHLGFDVLVEMFRHDVGSVRNGGLIVAEKRQPLLDQELQRHWLNLQISGNRYVNGDVIRSRIQTLDLRGKKENIAGLQLADLVVSPVGRHAMGKPDKGDWSIIDGKFRRSRSGITEGYGLVELQ